MELIRDIIEGYNYLAMDTEFPGVVVRPVGTFKNHGEYHYQTLRYGRRPVSQRCPHGFDRARVLLARALVDRPLLVHRANVDMLKLIQLGLTFVDEKGDLPIIEGEPSIWQFNFREFKLVRTVPSRCCRTPGCLPARPRPQAPLSTPSGVPGRGHVRPGLDRAFEAVGDRL